MSDVLCPGDRLNLRCPCPACADAAVWVHATDERQSRGRVTLACGNGHKWFCPAGEAQRAFTPRASRSLRYLGDREAAHLREIVWRTHLGEFSDEGAEAELRRVVTGLLP